METDLSKRKLDSRKVDAPLTRSEIMKRVKQKDTPAEIALRTALYHRGLRYRVHRRIEGITVDVAFLSAKVAVFVDGCFWHGCPLHASFPKSNQSYWLPKLAENKERDLRQSEKLSAAGWVVIRLWEHECRPLEPKILERVERIVRRRMQNEA